MINSLFSEKKIFSENNFFISENQLGSFTTSPVPQGLPAPVPCQKLTIKFPESPDQFIKTGELLFKG